MRTLSLVALSLLLPAAALAQEAAAPIEDRPALKINEVEHGLFFGVDAGGLFLFSPKAASGGGMSPGRVFAVNLGYEIKDLVSIGLMVMGTNTSTPSNFVSDYSTGTGAGMSGDFSSLVLGGQVKVSFFGISDSANVKRFYLFARVAGGYGLMSPKNFYSGGDGVLMGGVGVEYFTHLRHFSLGLTADFLYGVSHMGPGLMITPNLRYSF